MTPTEAAAHLFVLAVFVLIYFFTPTDKEDR